MSSSPAYYLHLSNENDVIADTDTPSEQEPLSSISDTELDAFENSCNDDADFNDFLNNFVQGKRSPTLQDHSDNVHDALSLAPEDTTTTQTHYNEPTTLENENALSPNPESKTTTTTKKRKQRGVSEHGGVEGAANFSLTTWHVSSPPRDREGSWLPVVVSPSERKGDGNDDETAPTPTLEKKDNKTVALESATLLQFDENIGLGCEGKKEFDEDEEAMAHEKLCSTTTTTTTTNSKWDDNWQQKFSELQVRLLLYARYNAVYIYILYYIVSKCSKDTNTLMHIFFSLATRHKEFQTREWAYSCISIKRKHPFVRLVVISSKNFCATLRSYIYNQSSNILQTSIRITLVHRTNWFRR